MSEWSLSAVLSSLHDSVENKLRTSRSVLGHAVAKGDASESAWLSMLQSHLPKRYEAARAFVVDSKGSFSDQIDIVIYDRQYTPVVLSHEGQTVLPAESVYAILEAKQTLNADNLAYASKKVASVRKLFRTSLPIPHAGGVYDAKEPSEILGGFLSFESDWKPPLGDTLKDALKASQTDEAIDLGCVAAHGTFWKNQDGTYSIKVGGKPATAFLLELISQLQTKATVPMVDIRAYAKWLPE